MAETKKVVIDAGHGGTDPGAGFHDRQEKNDVLKMALAVGSIMEGHGIDVVYTRIDDTYDTPLEKVTIANNSDADYFISIHRNAMPEPNTASGIMSLVYDESGAAGKMAENINIGMQEAGFTNHGVIERPGLVLLRKTRMPAVLVEVGFIDSDVDNQFFDNNFDAIAEGIAGGIMTVLEEEEKTPQEYYQIQTGAYQNQGLAKQMAAQLQAEGFPSRLVFEDGYFMVRTGAFESLDPAAQMEKVLRQYGYNTFITRD